MTEPSYTTQLAHFLPSTAGAEPTMSSVEIAELTGKAHKNVLADIRAVLGGLKIQPSSFEATYTNSQGKAQPCFYLPKRECLVLVSGYSVDLRAKIIDRWMELEMAPAAPAAIDFSDPAVLLGVVGHLQSKVSEQAMVIAEQGVRVKALDRLEGAKGSMCISDAAKTLGVGRDYLFKFMSAHRWIFKRAGNKNWLAYDDKRKALLLDHDDHLYMDNLGQERVATRVLVTAKGLVKLAELLARPLH
jgi:phage antirepressor YoqD-like protein